MGNTQSAEAPRRPATKLTKPRTNTSTSNLLAISSAPSRRSSTLSLPVARNKRSSTISLADVGTDGGDGAVKSKTGNRPQRRSLFRSKSAHPGSLAPADEPTGDINAKTTSNPPNRYSSIASVRVDVMEAMDSGASNSRPPIRAIRSAQTYFSQSQHPSRLSLVIEAQSPDSDPPEEPKQLDLRHRSFDDGVQDDAISPIERTSSHESIPIPIRRRSLLTPGLATRKSSKETIIRKSLPAQLSSSSTGSNESRNPNDKRNFRKTLPAQATTSQDQLRQYYYDQYKSTSSTLEGLPALEAGPFSELRPRTVTPSDLDYGHIGAYKLGSLRVTNGTVSPAPSGHEAGYLDAKFQTQRNYNEAEYIPLELPPRKEETRNINNEQTGTFVNVNQNQVRSELYDALKEPPRILETMVEIPTSALGLSNFQQNSSPGNSTIIQSPVTAYQMAQVYMQEIAASPFSFAESPPPSPQLEATSKPTEMEDNLFDDEHGSCVSLAPSAPQKSGLQHSRKSIEAQTSLGSPVTPMVKVEGSQQSLQRTLQNSKEQLSKPLVKADSGYSSKTSLRSTKSLKSLTGVENSNVPLVASALSPAAPAVPDKTPPPTPPKNLYLKYSKEISIASSTVQGSRSPDTEYAPATPAKDYSSRNSYGLDEALGSSQSSYLPETPRKDDVPQPPHRQAPPVPLKQTSSTWSGWTGPPPLPIKSIEQTRAAAKSSSETLTIPEKPAPTRRQSMPFSSYMDTTRPGLKSSASETSISSMTRRLQKRGPVAQTSFIVQGYTEIEPDRIPPISQEVSEHLEERLKNFPTLTHTYKSVQRTNSKETLATIFSVASAEQQAEEIPVLTRFRGQMPSAPSNDDVERSVSIELPRAGPGHGERFSFMPKILRRSTDQRRIRRQSLETMSRNQSFSRELDDKEIYITDFVSVSTSVSESPYNLAATALSPISGNRSYDLSSFNSRRESNAVHGRTTGMDSPSAVQYARERSRSRENGDRRSFGQGACENRNGAEERAYLPGYNPAAKYTVKEVPSIPNYFDTQIQDYSWPQKTKSPPPLSMKVPRKRMSSPPLKPSRAGPSAPVDVSRLRESEYLQNEFQTGNHRQDFEWQKQENLLHNRKQSAQEALSNARQSITLARPGNARPSLERQRHWSSEPVGKRPSFEQTYPPQRTQQFFSRSSIEEQQQAFARQSHISSQPRRDERVLARASFDSSTGQYTSNAHPLSQSQSYTQIRSEPLTMDRYNGGYAYDYEPGYGIGGSAGTRSGVSAASRKGVPGSLLWGVDFSDVPIMVMQRPDELGA